MNPKMMQQYTSNSLIIFPPKDLWSFTRITEQWGEGDIQIFQELIVHADTRRLKTPAWPPMGGTTGSEH